MEPMLRNYTPKGTGRMLVLCITEAVLGMMTCPANFYGLFYGALHSGNWYPVAQIIVFVLTLPLYGAQLMMAYRGIRTCLRLRAGLLDSIALSRKNLDDANIGLGIIHGIYGFALAIAWLIVVALPAGRLIPAMSAWSATVHIFKQDLTAQLVMIAFIILTIASLCVAIRAGKESIVMGEEMHREEVKELERRQALLSTVDSPKKIVKLPPPYRFTTAEGRRCS
ncbi:uncharacterized protein LOC129596133 [Paramacrobiotus metropolitanus]|uniref:uncharacterized protein LOC129596133 n=1 Tax=Paramacrobiotus metropolitanus TaxID=2943436 RepID=UPI002445DE2D|nr:uncharacterized protein LOC129596133 [Paramacrobiotus metropolitanus]